MSDDGVIDSLEAGLELAAHLIEQLGALEEASTLLDGLPLWARATNDMVRAAHHRLDDARRLIDGVLAA